MTATPAAFRWCCCRALVLAGLAGLVWVAHPSVRGSTLALRLAFSGLHLVWAVLERLMNNVGRFKTCLGAALSPVSDGTSTPAGDRNRELI